MSAFGSISVHIFIEGGNERERVVFGVLLHAAEVCRLGLFDVWKYAVAVCAVRCAPFVRDNGVATPRPNATLQHSPALSLSRAFPALAQKLPTHFKGNGPL